MGLQTLSSKHSLVMKLSRRSRCGFMFVLKCCFWACRCNGWTLSVIHLISDLAKSIFTTCFVMIQSLTSLISLILRIMNWRMRCQWLLHINFCICCYFLALIMYQRRVKIWWLIQLLFIREIQHCCCFLSNSYWRLSKFSSTVAIYIFNLF